MSYLHVYSIARGQCYAILTDVNGFAVTFYNFVYIVLCTRYYCRIKQNDTGVSCKKVTVQQKNSIMYFTKKRI